MRFVLLDQLSDGDELAKNLYANDGRILLRAGKKITLPTISKLKQLGIPAVYILDPRLKDMVEKEDVVSDENKAQVIS